MTTRSYGAPRRTSTVEPSAFRTSTSHVAPFSESRSTAFACPPGTSLSAAALAASAPEPVAPPSPSSPPTALATPTPPRASASAAPPARITFLELVMGGVLQGAYESPMRWRGEIRNRRLRLRSVHARLSVLVGIEGVGARHGDPDGRQAVPDLDGALMGREYRVEALVSGRRLISRAAAQLDALLAKPGEDRRPVDLARPEPHHPLAEARAAALGALAVPRLVLSGSLRPVALAVVARPALAGLACRLRARHDAPGAVDGRVEQRLGVGRLDAAENHRRLAHGGSDKAFLARERRRAALPHHPDVDTAVRLAPGVVVVIVHLVGRRRAEDLEHLRDDRIAPRIGIFAGQGHRLDVGLPELAVDAEEDRRAVHLALRRVLPEALAFRERQEAARRLVAEAARAEVDADPDVSVVAVEEVDVVVPRADGPELARRELVEPALGRERRCLDRFEHVGLHGHRVLEADAEADLVHDGVHEAGQGRLHVGGEQVGADRLVAAADIEADPRRADVIGVGECAADGL